MRSEGKVSVWVGNGEDRSAFDKMLEYSIDGDYFRSSEFCSAVGLDSYDPVKFGGHFFPRRFTNLRIMMHGTDFLSQAMEKYPTIPDSNCIVMLYGFDMENSESEFSVGAFRFMFLGAFDYVVG